MQQSVKAVQANYLKWADASIFYPWVKNIFLYQLIGVVCQRFSVNCQFLSRCKLVCGSWNMGKATEDFF